MLTTLIKNIKILKVKVIDHWLTEFCKVQTKIHIPKLGVASPNMNYLNLN